MTKRRDAIKKWEGLILKSQKKWRVTRNEENDCVIEGKRGVISVYPDGDLDVWVKRLFPFHKMEKFWKAAQHWYDVGLFVRPYSDLDIAAKYIKARKRRRISPEQRQKAIETFKRLRSLRQNSRQDATTAEQSTKTVPNYPETPKVPLITGAKP